MKLLELFQQSLLFRIHVIEIRERRETLEVFAQKVQRTIFYKVHYAIRIGAKMPQRYWELIAKEITKHWERK